MINAILRLGPRGSGDAVLGRKIQWLGGLEERKPQISTDFSSYTCVCGFLSVVS